MKPDSPEKLDAMFDPSSIAIVGATENIAKWGFGVINSLMIREPDVEIYPVNPGRDEVFGLEAYDDLTKISVEVDLAVIAVPPSVVPEVMEDCVEKGVKIAIVITAGFGETGEEGLKLQEEIAEIAHQGETRVVGPNCMGHFNVHNDLYTSTFMPELTRGKISIISQSGNFGVYMVNKGAEEGFGFSKYITTGNEADLHFEDFLEYLAQDPDTEVIIGYIEELREGRRFLDLASEITKEKPIFLIKAGRTEVGSEAARSHTGAMAGDDSVYESVFRQTGVIRVKTLQDLFDTIKAFQLQPLPKGKGVGIITGGGGFGVLAADACQERGLDVPELSEETLNELDDVLPPRWSHGNPVDMVATGPLTYDCLPALLKDENVDIILAVYSLALAGGWGYDFVPEVKEIANKIVDRAAERERSNFEDFISMAKEFDKPIIGAGLSPFIKGSTLLDEIREKIPTYPSPERAARVVHHMVKYSAYLDEKSDSG